MSDREPQTDDVDRIRDGIRAELEGSWEFDSLQRLDRLTADASDVIDENPDEAGPLVDPLADLLYRTVDEEYSTAGGMIGKENLLRSVKQQTALSLADLATGSPERMAPVITELTRVAVQEGDEDVRESLETVFDSVAFDSLAFEDHDAVRDAVPVLEDALDCGDFGDQSRAVETIGWIGYRDSAAVADLVDILQSLVDEQNARLFQNILETLCRIMDEHILEETTILKSVIAFGPTNGAYLASEPAELRASAASFLNIVAQEDTGVIREFVPELVDLLVGSQQAQSEAGEALERIGGEHPEAIAEVSPRLRVGLASDDPDLQEQTAGVIKNAAGGGGVTHRPGKGDPGLLVDLVPDLADLLVESEQARSEAGEALERIGSEYPEAIIEVVPQLRAGLTSDDHDLQARTAEVILEIAGGGIRTGRGDPGVVADLVPDLADLLVESEQARSEAGEALGRIGSEHPEAIVEVMPQLRAGLTSNDPGLRKRAAKAIKRIAAGGDPGVVADLVPDLADLLVNSEQARVDARWALGRIGREHPEAIAEVTAQMRAGLTSDDPDIQVRTAKVVKETAGGGLGSTEGDPGTVVDLVPDLINLLVKSESEQARSEVDKALGRIMNEHPESIVEVTTQLRAGITDDDPDLQKRAAAVINTIAREGDPGKVVDLAPDLADLLIESEQAWSEARWALERIGSEYPEAIVEVIPQLRAGITDDDPDLQKRAAAVINTIARKGDPGVVADLVPDLADLFVESEQARFNAGRALERIGSEHLGPIVEVMPRLRAGLTGDDPDLQRRAANVILETVDDCLESAEGDTGVVVNLIPGLADLLVESRPARAGAGEALERIGSEHPEAIVEVTPQLRAGLTGDDPELQERTAEVVLEIAREGGPGTVVDLVPELVDLLVETVRVRSDARAALEHIVRYHPKPVKTALSEPVDDLHSRGTDIRTQVTKLIRGGAEVHPNVFLNFSPELTALLDDERYEVRKNAAVALAAISEVDLTDLAAHRSRFRELIAHEDTTHETKIVLVGVLCRLGSETVVDPVLD